MSHEMWDIALMTVVLWQAPLGSNIQPFRKTEHEPIEQKTCLFNVHTRGHKL